MYAHLCGVNGYTLSVLVGMCGVISPMPFWRISLLFGHRQGANALGIIPALQCWAPITMLTYCQHPVHLKVYIMTKDFCVTSIIWLSHSWGVVCSMPQNDLADAWGASSTRSNINCCLLYTTEQLVCHIFISCTPVLPVVSNKDCYGSDKLNKSCHTHLNKGWEDYQKMIDK